MSESLFLNIWWIGSVILALLAPILYAILETRDKSFDGSLYIIYSILVILSWAILVPLVLGLALAFAPFYGIYRLTRYIIDEVEDTKYRKNNMKKDIKGK